MQGPADAGTQQQLCTCLLAPGVALIPTHRARPSPLLAFPQGTSLGDPIEVNAAAGALLAPSGARRSGAAVGAAAPLSLLASKSTHGHGEPAAGLIALLHATSAAAAAARHPVLHLRTLNPLVAGVLEGLRPAAAALGGAAARGRGVAIGRQPAPLAIARASEALAGTSSFAFMVGPWLQAAAHAYRVLRGAHSASPLPDSLTAPPHRSHRAADPASPQPAQGTNAHVVTSTALGPAAWRRAAAPAAATAPTPPAWHRARHWVTPPAHLLIAAAAALPAASPSRVALFSAWLGAPQLAYVWQHRVAGAALFPGAGFMEMAGAAVRAALDPSSAGVGAGGWAGGGGNGAGGLGVTIEGVTIAAPLVLPAQRPGAPAPVLQCAVGLADGALRISSARDGGRDGGEDGGGGGEVVHVAARAAAVFWAAAGA
jgi:hypothetical protein